MSWILAKLGFPQAIGVFWEAESLHISRVAATPLGVRELDQFSVPLAAAGASPVEPLAAALERLPAPRHRLEVAVGVPTEAAYFATRPISTTTDMASPTVLLRESLRSTSVSVERMVATVDKFQPDKRDVVSIAACPRELITQVSSVLADGDARLTHAEPAPCALLRLARTRDRSRTKSQVLARLFINQSRALAMLAIGDRPIAWRTAPLEPGDEAAGMIALVRSLATIAAPCGIERPLDGVVVHGQAKLERLVDTEWMRGQLEMSVEWQEGPALAAAEIARGLALAAVDEDPDRLNLAADLRRPPTLWEIFPWREAVLYAAALLAMAGWLWMEKVQKDDLYVTAMATSAGSATASLPKSELEKERKALRDRVAAVQRFLKNRIVWTAHQRELRAQLPRNVFLTSFSGQSALEKAGKRKRATKRSLVIQGAVSVTESGMIPHEVDHLLDKIRHHPLITNDFPVVELTDLQQLRAARNDRELAMFTVLCLPKGTKK